MIHPIVTIGSRMKSLTLSIGELAKQTGTKVVTIRYYEKTGLMPPPPRTAGNYRTYGESHLRRLTFIRRCRELGFTLEQVLELIGFAEEGDKDCCEVDLVAQAQLEAVEHKINDLNAMAKELRRLIKQCKGGVIADCRILESLSG